MLHDGNVHYARNGSAFRSGGYTKLDLPTTTRLDIEDFGAIGIGTVDLMAQRAVGAPDICAITLHDVLHIPAAPCNGISIEKLEAADVHVATGEGGCVMTQKQTTEQLFAGTRVGWLFRVALYGEPAEDSSLHEMELVRPSAASLLAREEKLVRLGDAARLFQDIE